MEIKEYEASASERGELLIAIIKDTNDVVLACSEQSAERAEKSMREIVGRPASETWPDDNGKLYREDDAEVIGKKKPKLLIRETVLFKGKEIPVLTDKYPVLDSKAALVLVFARRPQGLEHFSRHSVARVKPSGFEPTAPTDVPSPASYDKTKVVFETGPDFSPFMEAEEAEHLVLQKNTEILESGFEGEWCVWLAPNFH
ncbi:MAG TPA: hypothetical protein DDW52_24640 [Planctomycetaceae bacterium]|nr:hypothetical protein [Planctomycetaceae bacterium]